MSVYYNSVDVNALNMLRTTFHNRPAMQLENASVRVTVMVQGGHAGDGLPMHNAAVGRPHDQQPAE